MTSDDQPICEGKFPARKVLELDFSHVLLNIIESAKNDPTQYRNLIYEMARVHLQREA